MVEKKKFVKIDKFDEYIYKYRRKLIEDGKDPSVAEHIINHDLRENVIIIYTNEEQDRMLNRLLEIMRSPGGTTWLIDNMDYMPQFEHRKLEKLWKHL